MGTVSLGLLTGVSYTLTTLTLPSLLFLPTAPSASQTHTYLTTRSTQIRRLLSTIAISALTFSYVLSPPRAKHPYLLWTSLVAGLAMAPGVAEKVARVGSVESEESHRINLRELDESAVMVTPPTTASQGSESGDEPEINVNGEVVRRGVERGRAIEAARAGIFGVGFFMAVVGIWGDGS